MPLPEGDTAAVVPCGAPGAAGRHRASTYLTNAGDVCVVPGVVVHQDGSVGHGGDLVAVVPPGHHLGILHPNTTHAISASAGAATHRG